MSIGAKKFDRYMLPSLLALDLVALLGWLCLVQSLLERLKAVRTSTHQLPNHLATLSLIFLLHGLPGFLHYPYYLTYFNPLLGGSVTAPHVLFVGWGEGLEAAAEWLNKQPEAETL